MRLSLQVYENGSREFLNRDLLGLFFPEFEELIQHIIFRLELFSALLDFFHCMLFGKKSVLNYRERRRLFQGYFTARSGSAFPDGTMNRSIRNIK